MNQLITDVCDVDGHFILVTVKPNDTFRTVAKLYQLLQLYTARTVCFRSGLICHTAEVLAKAYEVCRLTGFVAGWLIWV